MTIRIKDWSKFQHFKDRTPPWVKLYRDILDDPDWHELDGQSAKVLTMLWLIASEDETHTGALPEMRKLSFRLRIEENKLKHILDKLSHWLVQSDIETISERYQSDAPETETETYTEKEKEVKRSKAATPPQDVDVEVWEDWKQLRKAKRATVTETVVNEARKEATKAGMSLNQFLKEWCLRGSQGLKAEWLKNNQNDKRTEHQKRQDAQTQAIFGHLYDQQQPATLIEGEVYEAQPIARRLGG